MNKKSILIAILNWNGSNDTIECCNSLSKLVNIKDFNFLFLILDNASTSEDFEFLKLNLPGFINGDIRSISNGEVLLEQNEVIEAYTYDSGYFLLRSKVNHGFAKGCNIMADLALNLEYDYIVFLNNDTVVEPDFLNKLIEGAVSLNADGVIPQIRFFHDKSLIWNCGGEINKFGKRKYFFANKSSSEVIDRPFRVSFATGCCLMFKASYFRAIGRFSENFFFGEEDIELSLRLLKLKARLYCIPTSIIYHKVGASLSGNEERALNKSYIHYLNRLINMKTHLGLLWFFWLIPATIKVFVNLIFINKISFIRALSFIRCILSDAIALDSVTKNKFESTINNGFMFSYEEDRQ
ncbi:glycosyltransferase family 2 protein [Shewanella hafniensis]|uniref:glycosyltransferase family 2 protein n=1 Tax=Shewanella hafniensis TaxID=365590 RepID=UPI00200C974E|nr:glycosyltransferase family 2 protein [Shewanella hafniensis]MCL1133021.1 glycosyltransferase family 2 protein [Shewanella hafniensis]